MANVNVSIWTPDSTVNSMRDEVQDGSVQRAVDAAVVAYKGVDTDGHIPVKTYGEDFDNAVEAAANYAVTTDGVDILVIVTDFECDDREKAERLLRGSNDMFVLVPLSNQGYDVAWAEKLDADHEGPNNVDVISTDDLANPDVVMAEVRPFLEKVGAGV